MSVIVNENGREYQFDDFMFYADPEITETLHADFAGDESITEQYFFDCYCILHAEKYGYELNSTINEIVFGK